MRRAWPPFSGTPLAPLRPRILLAEDDAELRELLARALRQLGYEVVECRDGVDLLGEIDPQAPPGKEIDFELIISDICMPGITGMFLLEGLQQWDRPRPLPIILITAFGDEATHTRARELGAAAIFDKPFEADELMDKVREIVPPPNARRPPEQGTDMTRRPRVLLAEDDEELRALLVWSLHRERYGVTECVDGPDLVSKLAWFLVLGEPLGFDLVISDIRMPGASALEILEAMRDCEGLPPVILITAFGDAHTHAEAERLGVAAIFDKPFEIDDLLAKAQDLLGPNSAPTGRPSVQEPMPPATIRRAGDSMASDRAGANSGDPRPACDRPTQQREPSADPIEGDRS